MSLQIALENIQRRVAEVCSRAGRKPESVQLVAVSKAFSAERIREAYDLGLRDFGENRVQELNEKHAVLPEDIRWHMIGRLQTNKVKEVIGRTALIHSLDRLELFEKIDAEARKKGIREVACLLQVNGSGELSKAGFDFKSAELFLRQLASDSPVKIKGLMTMGQLTEDREKIRTVFKNVQKFLLDLKIAYPQMDLAHLSMGMSGDFEMAIEAGATMIRVGTALFGAREEEL